MESRQSPKKYFWYSLIKNHSGTISTPLKTLFLWFRGSLNHKNNKQQENEQFYIQNGISRISIPLCRQNNTRNVGKVENRQTNQQLVSFYFFSSKHLVFFFMSVFFYKSKTFLTSLFNLSPVLTNHWSLFRSLIFWKDWIQCDNFSVA